MLQSLILYLPSFICVLFFLMYILRTRKSYVQRLFTIAALVTCVATFVEAYRLGNFDDGYTLTRVILNILCFLAVPILPILCFLILQDLSKMGHSTWLGWLLYAFPIVTAFGIGIHYTICGWTNTVIFNNLLIEQYGDNDIANALLTLDQLPIGFQKNAYLWQLRLQGIYYLLIIFNDLVCMGAVFVIGYKRKEKIGRWWRFLFKKEPISPFYAAASSGLMCLFWGCFGVMLQHHPVLNQPWVLMLYSLIWMLSIYNFLSVGLTSSNTAFTLESAIRPLFYEQNEGEYDEQTPEETPDASIKNTRDDSDGQSVYQTLIKSMSLLMERDLLYLNPDITIEDVAAELCTNRVYVSRAVNNLLGITFRDYINSLRLRYAKDYMLSHPQAKQDDIAFASGYADATAFNKKFKQVEGCTPREWIERGGDVATNKPSGQ